MELEEDNNEKVDRLSSLRKPAGDHTAMGNKLINITRRMKVKAKDKRGAWTTQAKP